MIYLFLSIFTSSIILVIFKFFEKYKIDTFQAIVFNYFFAFGVGTLLYGKQWNASITLDLSWVPYMLIIGFLFISLFLIMGKSSQINGIGITSVVVKMSLVIPVVSAIILYKEQLNTIKAIGIVGAIIGVLLITYKKNNQKVETKKTTPLLLIILFIGSGMLDALLNYVEKTQLNHLSAALFSAFGFGVAFAIGILIMFVRKLKSKNKLSSPNKILIKNILGGLVLGVPNFFSIYFLLMAINHPLDDSITYALNNVGIVLLSTLIGILFFKESTTKRKIIGTLIALTSIFLLT